MSRLVHRGNADEVVGSTGISVLARMVVVALALFALLSGNATELKAQDHDHGEDTNDVLESDPLARDAAVLAKNKGMAPEDARAALERQPEIGRMEAALTNALPEAYGGLMVDYAPEYRIKVLVEPGRSAEVEAEIERRGFDDLQPFVRLEETRFTRRALLDAVERVRKIADRRVASSGIDLRAGVVEVGAATDEDVAAIRDAVARSRDSIEARDVIVKKVFGTGEESSSYGGLKINQSDGTSPCTSGFSVVRTTDAATGVATAAHCKNGGYSLHQVGLDYITEAYGGSSDAQWHKTPSLADENKIKTGTDLWRYITSKKSRSQMYIDEQVCHYGRTTGYGCGYIRDKNFEPVEPPGINFYATFILVGNDDTEQGDSGGPWFIGNTAYGIHHGSEGNNLDRPVFMPQNYLSNINLLVRTS